MIAMLLQAQAASPFGIGLLPIVAMLVFAYLVLFLPQQRRQKKWQAMLESLKTGDKVVTSGGLRGTVIALKDDALHLRVPPDNLRIEVTKASIVSLAAADEGEHAVAVPLRVRQPLEHEQPGAVRERDAVRLRGVGLAAPGGRQAALPREVHVQVRAAHDRHAAGER